MSIFNFLIIKFVLVNFIYGLPLPLNQYAYMLARNNLTAREFKLNEKEKVVNLYFEKLKIEEFGQTLKYFYPSRPIENELNNITSRPLYNLLKNMPKGGNLHIHEFQMLERRKLLEIIFNSSEYDLLYICDKSSDPVCTSNPTNCTCLSHSLKYFMKNIPNGWIKVKGSKWNIDEIVNKTVLTNILNNLDEKIYPTDSNARWDIANTYGVFSFYSELVRLNKTRFDYMKACLDSSIDEMVQIIEFRRSNFGNLFYFDKDGNEVSISANDEIDALIRFKNDYIAQNQLFIDFIFLIYSTRSQSKNVIKSNLDAALKLQVQYPQVIRGYDLVGEEDQGHTLLFHSDTLMQALNYSQTSNGTFNLVFHAAETNWPEDIMPAKYGDSVSTLENIYDSILLRTSRIGHGIGLFKNPNLYEIVKDREIAIEVCPSSNQILGYVADLRNHPAINFYRSGIPIVISGDDPGSFGYNDLTVDYYLAYMAWGLDLYDLKTIAQYSIRYSSIPEEIKQAGFSKFNQIWSNFIDSKYSIACETVLKENLINISNLLPTYGPNDQQTEISLFGYGFETAICQKIYCYFNDLKTDAELVKINEIKCKTPIKLSNNPEEVSVSIEIGKSLFSTGYNYTFLTTNPIINNSTFIPITTTTATTTTRNGSIKFKILEILLYLPALFSIFLR